MDTDKPMILQLVLDRLNQKSRALLAQLVNENADANLSTRFYGEYSNVVRDLADELGVEIFDGMPVDIAQRPDLWPAWVQRVVGEAYDRGCARD